MSDDPEVETANPAMSALSHLAFLMHVNETDRVALLITSLGRARCQLLLTHAVGVLESMTPWPEDDGVDFEHFEAESQRWRANVEAAFAASNLVEYTTQEAEVEFVTLPSGLIVPLDPTDDDVRSTPEFAALAAGERVETPVDADPDDPRWIGGRIDSNFRPCTALTAVDTLKLMLAAGDVDEIEGYLTTIGHVGCAALVADVVLELARVWSEDATHTVELARAMLDVRSDEARQ